MPFTKVIKSLRLVSHLHVESSHERSMLGRIADEARECPVALDREVSHYELTICNLFSCQHATDLIRTGGAKFLFQLADAAAGEDDVNHLSLSRRNPQYHYWHQLNQWARPQVLRQQSPKDVSRTAVQIATRPLIRLHKLSARV